MDSGAFTGDWGPRRRYVAIGAALEGHAVESIYTLDSRRVEHGR